MTGLDWPQPKPTELHTVAPTLANTLLTCEKKAAFQLDPELKDLARPTTRTALGSAAHSLIESVLGGEAPPIGSRTEWLAEAWSRALEGQVRKLAEAWPGRTLPPTAAWPGLTATRRRLLRRLEDLEPIRTVASPHTGPAGSGVVPDLPWVERWLEDPDTGIAGKADLVEESGDSVRVVDQKTGVHQEGILDSQRRQLLLYAHLTSITLGRAVSKAAVIDVKGKEECFNVDPADVVREVATVVSARERFNRARSTGEFTAAPSPENCRFCAFRVICPEYWSARSSDPTDVGWPPNDVLGPIIEHGHANEVIIGLAEHPTSLLLTDDVAAAHATEVAAVDLDRNGVFGVRMRWNSLVRFG